MRYNEKDQGNQGASVLGERKRKEVNEQIKTITANCDKCYERNREGDVMGSVPQKNTMISR